MEIENTEDHLFRYRKANDFSLDELENSYIYFPSSNELNDPFDASHNLIGLTTENSEMEKLYNQLLEESPEDLVKEYIKKTYQKKPEVLREMVVNNIGKFHLYLRNSMLYCNAYTYSSLGILCKS